MAILKRPLKLAVLAILVFGLLGFAGAGHAFTTVQAAAAGAPTVTEKVKAAEGVTLSGTLTLQISQEAQNDDGVVPPAVSDPWTLDIPVSKLNKKAGVYTYSTTLDLASKTQAAGEYTFKVVQTAPAQKTGSTGWDVDTSTYYIRVLVKNNGTRTYLVTKGKVSTDAKDKLDGLTFENTYSAITDSDPTVTKHVVNGNANTLYHFTTTFADSSTNTVVLDSIEIVGGENVKKNGKTLTYDLKDGESIVFKNVPVGLRYRTVETEDPNVERTSIAVKANGQVVDDKGEVQANAKAVINGRDSGSQLVGEKTNSMAYTNILVQKTSGGGKTATTGKVKTGDATRIAGWAAILGGAALILIVTVVSKRRKDAE